eukprot:GHRQ01034263.1.p2 GENE.GHRQ01034263.1~~GHRQ01034263.1.p2  ORF type:complete len:118 (-),score=8.68 GHRQ01034263.1:264-617(-)
MAEGMLRFSSSHVVPLFCPTPERPTNLLSHTHPAPSQPTHLEAQWSSNILHNLLHSRCALFLPAVRSAHKNAQAPRVWHVTGPHAQISAQVSDRNVPPAAPLCVFHGAGCTASFGEE